MVYADSSFPELALDECHNCIIAHTRMAAAITVKKEIK